MAFAPVEVVGIMKGRGSAKSWQCALVVIATMLFVALSNEFAYAQPSGGLDPGPSGKASTGTLVAAAMETAGYVAHAKIIKDLQELIEGIGALIFLGCVISGILTAAVLGNYAGAKWLLIGPPIFFFLINPTESATGVEWQFGVFEDRRGEQSYVLQNANVQPASGDKVSGFFHQYNRLVSELVQDLVKFFTRNKPDPQMMFMARQKTIDQAFSMQIGDPGLMALARLTFAACSEPMESARRIARGESEPEYKNEPEYAQAVIKYCEMMPKADKQLTDEVRDYVRKAIFLENAKIPADRVSCSTLWEWMFHGVQRKATSIMEAAKKDAAPLTAPDYVPDFYRKVYSEILVKMGKLSTDTKKPSTEPICDSSSGRMKVTNLDVNAAVPMVFAAWMIRKMYTDDPRGQMIQELYSTAGLETQPFHYKEFHGLETNQAKVRRWRNSRLAESAKWEAYTLAMLIPYVQGAGLFVLGATFPFFALMVLIPGRAGSFFTWCALWVWLKSWDVGWALVMIVDQALWDLMPHSTYFRIVGTDAGGNLVSDPSKVTSATFNTDPVTVFEAAFAGDYSYTLSQYWVLIGVVISAVPIISAHAVLGSKKAIAGVMINGLKTLGQHYGRVGADWIGVEQTAEADIQRERSQLSHAAANLDFHYRSLLRSSQGFKPGAHSQKTMGGANQMLTSLAKGDINGARAAFSGQGKAMTGEPGSANFDPSKRSAFDELAGVDSALDLIMNPGKQNPMDLIGKLDGGEGSLGDASTARAVALGQPDLASPKTRDFRGPTPELEDYRRRIEMTRRQGDVYRSAAEPILNAGGLLGVAGALLTRVPVANKALPYAGGREVGYAMGLNQAGVDLQRLANAHSVQYLSRLADHYYYEGSKSGPALSAEQRRGGASNRGEWWSSTDSPERLMGDTLNADAKLRLEVARINARMTGDFFHNLKPADKGRFVR